MEGGRAWGAMSITEKAYELQMVLGACGIELFSALIPHLIQDKLREAAPSESAYIEKWRQKFAALPVKQFEAVFNEVMNPMRISEGPDLNAFGPKGSPAWAYGAALVDHSPPVPEYLRHFEEEGYMSNDAAFMARHMVKRMDEPACSEFERSQIGPGSKSERNRRWVRLLHDVLRAQGKA